MPLALTEGERYGYALKRAILQLTDGKVNLGSGALFGSNSEMLEQGSLRNRTNGLTRTLMTAVRDESRDTGTRRELARLWAHALWDLMVTMPTEVCREPAQDLSMRRPSVGGRR